MPLQATDAWFSGERRRSSRAGNPAKKPQEGTGQFRVQLSRFALAMPIGSRKCWPRQQAASKLSKDQKQQWTAWLPSNDARGIAVEPAADRRARGAGLKSSLPPGRPRPSSLTSEQAVAILLAAMDRTTCGPGVVVGKTLAYWASVLRFAGALVARQQYLPGLDAEADGTAVSARWEPVLIGEARLEAERLARSMPHACRALGQDEANPPEPRLRPCCFQVVATLVDHLVRTAAARAGQGTGRFAEPARSVGPCPALGERPDERARPAELARLAEQVRQWRRPIERRRVGAVPALPAAGRAEAGDRQAARPVAGRLPAPGGGRPEPARARRGGLEGAGHEAVVSTATVSSRASTCWRPWGRRRRSARGSRQSLKAAAPAGYDLDSARRARVPLGTRRGRSSRRASACFFPSWWSRKGTKLRLAARAVVTPSPKMKSKSMLSLDEILNFHWEVSLGDETLTYRGTEGPGRAQDARWSRCAASGSSSSAEEINAALEFWKKKGEASITAREAVKMALGDGRGPRRARLRGRAGLGLARRPARPARRGLGLRDAGLARGLPGHAAALPGPRLFLAGFPAPLGPRRLPGRRHGAGQDRSRRWP